MHIFLSKQIIKRSKKASNIDPHSLRYYKSSLLYLQIFSIKFFDRSSKIYFIDSKTVKQNDRRVLSTVIEEMEM